MTRIVTAIPLHPDSFSDFGDVIDKKTGVHFPINNGMTERYHALAGVDIAGANARPIISIATGKPYEFPLRLSMVERHPLGSQAFIPLASLPFVIIVCPGTANGPGEPKAFVTCAGQGINYHRNVWHAVLTPIRLQQDFLIVDRDGVGENLEEHYFSEPYEVHLPADFREKVDALG